VPVVRRSSLDKAVVFVPTASVEVLVADRDERVHEAARAALGDVLVAGRGVALRHARTLDEALARVEGAALVIVERDLGAEAVLARLREGLGDRLARAVVRVRAADAAALPDEAFLERHDVDGILSQDDLAPVRLYAMARALLAAHANSRAMLEQIEGLRTIAESLSTVSTRAALEVVLRSLVEEIAASGLTHDYLCAPFVDELDAPDALVLGGGALAGADPAAAVRALARDLGPLDGAVALRDGRVVFPLGASGLLALRPAGPLPDRVLALVEVLGHKLEIARRNVDLARKLEREREAAREIYHERMAVLGRLAASLAHELNTPIGIAVHAASLVLEYEAALRAAVSAEDGRATLDDLREASGLIARNLAQAAALIRSFKSMAVDQAADQVETFEPAKVVAETVHALEHVLKKKGQRVSLAVAGDAARLTNNPGMLSQVVQNLVTNASVHGYAGGPGEIAVRARSTADAFELEVEDRGAGMDERGARRVFEPFVTTARHRGGSGLGMSIVYHIVTQSYGGEIAVDSAIGRGTRFRVRLPLERPAPEPGPVA